MLTEIIFSGFDRFTNTIFLCENEKSIDGTIITNRCIENYSKLEFLCKDNPCGIVSSFIFLACNKANNAKRLETCKEFIGN